MIFLPSTNSQNIKVNILVLHSIALFGFGLYLIVSQLFIQNAYGGGLNYLFGGFCLFFGLISMFTASKQALILVPLNLILVLALFVYIFFNTTDPTTSSPVVLAGFVAFILLTNILYNWKVGLVVTILLVALTALRLVLLKNGSIEITIADNPAWMISINFMVIVTYCCIIVGYFGHKMRSITLIIEQKHEERLKLFRQRKADLVDISGRIENIDHIFQKKATEINKTVIEHAEVLSPETTSTYEELLEVGSKVAKSIDEVVLTINTQIQKEEPNRE